MVRIENRCNGCKSALYPCIECGLKHTPVYYCDKCGEEVDALYDYDLGEWCADCILEEYPRIDE